MPPGPLLNSSDVSTHHHHHDGRNKFIAKQILLLLVSFDRLFAYILILIEFKILIGADFKYRTNFKTQDDGYIKKKHTHT